MRKFLFTAMGIGLSWTCLVCGTTAPSHGAPWRPDRSILIPTGSPPTSGTGLSSDSSGPSKDKSFVLRGRILDDEMNPVSGAGIFLGNHETLSGDGGGFTVEGIRPGYHEFIVRAGGFIEEKFEILAGDPMGEIEMMLRRPVSEPRGEHRVERRTEVAAALDRKASETFLKAAPTLSGTTGFIDLPDTGVPGAGQKAFGVHFMRMDGVTGNADLFAYKYSQGIGDSMELSLGFVDSKLGRGSSEISGGSGILGMKYRIPESLEKVDFALVGQVSGERSQFFGVADFMIPEGKLSVSLKNCEAGGNAALNLGVELGMPELDRFVGLGKSTFIFETEQADARFNIFNAGLRHRTGRHQVLDVFILQDRRIKDDNGNRSRNQRTYGIGGSLEF